MKKHLPILVLAFPFISCNQIPRQIEEAKEARKKNDSIMKAFKEVDDRLDSLNSAYQSKNDSIYIMPKDTSPGR